MSEKRQFPMTQEEFDSLKEELDILKNERRKEIAERIGIARGYGDLSENSEYDAAKEEQAQNEEAIKDDEERVKNAVVIADDKIDYSTVGIGVKVKVFDFAFDEEVIYTITGSVGADPLNNKISNESPIARALMGNHIGDEVDVDSPNGSFKMKIIEIEKKK